MLNSLAYVVIIIYYAIDNQPLAYFLASKSDRLLAAGGWGWGVFFGAEGFLDWQGLVVCIIYCMHTYLC